MIGASLIDLSGRSVGRRPGVDDGVYLFPVSGGAPKRMSGTMRATGRSAGLRT
jgi:hypothetical protein